MGRWGGGIRGQGEDRCDEKWGSGTRIMGNDLQGHQQSPQHPAAAPNTPQASASSRTATESAVPTAVGPAGNLNRRSVKWGLLIPMGTELQTDWRNRELRASGTRPGVCTTQRALTGDEVVHDLAVRRRRG